MAITSTAAAAVSDTAAKTSKAAASKDKLAKDMNQFLTLLTAQLAHLDPLSPMDSTEFTNQLVQFANVEQNIATNANLEKMIAMQQSQIQMSSVSYIGKTVEAETSSLPLQNSKAEFKYAFSTQPASAIVTIYDEVGVAVKSFAADTTNGPHTVSWDGKDDQGNQLPDGTYKIGVTPMAIKENDDITTAIGVTGKVTGVSTVNGSVSLSLGSATVSIDKIMSIRDAL
jgi:flagellar basal-body rod modification protein FlgD